MPPLGCGNGGLDWADVKPLIIEAFASLPNLEMVVFEPGAAPSPEQIKVRTQKPDMTRSGALIIKLIELYGIPGYRLKKLEIQKLAYFIQEAGETDLRLNFVKHQFGPYAENLNFPLQRMEGHYIRGYGDRTQTSQVYVLREGQQAAERFLGDHPDAKKRLDQVGQLIWGFETPYGMELLSSIHWVARENPIVKTDPEAAIAAVHSWNARNCTTLSQKSAMLKMGPLHPVVAWVELEIYGVDATTSILPPQ